MNIIKEDISSLQQKIALYEDMKAYEALYLLLSPSLNSFCFSFVKSREASEEIVSDVFIKLWQVRNKLPEIENLKVYLYTIAKNFCLNYIARNFKNPVVRLDEMDIEPVVSLGTPEDLCISADNINKIQQCIRELPPQCRIIFQLVKEDGMTYKEAAEILNISVLTVRNQVFIATRKIARVNSRLYSIQNAAYWQALCFLKPAFTIDNDRRFRSFPKKTDFFLNAFGTFLFNLLS